MGVAPVPGGGGEPRVTFLESEVEQPGPSSVWLCSHPTHPQTWGSQLFIGLGSSRLYFYLFFF